MSLYIDQKYINLVSYKLEKFSWKDKCLASCRCPMCGDSKRDKTKKRFYFFIEKGIYFVKCHNCQYTTAFSKFLQDFDANLYREYAFERFQGNSNREKNAAVQEEIAKSFATTSTMQKLKNTCLFGLKSIAELEDTHYAKEYIVSRKIPEKYHSLLYFSENFKDTASKLDPNKEVMDEPRIIIPFYDITGSVFAIQGRSLDKTNNLRYITIKDENYAGAKLYGMERYDPMLKGYIVEGPFDSLFLPNTIAAAGSDLTTIQNSSIDLSNFVFVYDNEPRNTEICKQINKCIDKGYSVCIWPSSMTKKDINDMVLTGINPHIIVDANTYSGLAAKAKFNEWKKV